MGSLGPARGQAQAPLGGGGATPKPPRARLSDKHWSLFRVTFASLDWRPGPAPGAGLSHYATTGYDPAMDLGHYILGDDHEPVRVDLLTWARWFEGKGARKRRIVAKTRLGHGESSAGVSTVFIGLDFQFGEGPLLFFETMVFGGPHDQYTQRYSTWGQAEAGHAWVVAALKAGKDPRRAGE